MLQNINEWLEKEDKASMLFIYKSYFINGIYLQERIFVKYYCVFIYNITDKKMHLLCKEENARGRFKRII